MNDKNLYIKHEYILYGRQPLMAECFKCDCKCKDSRIIYSDINEQFLKY